MLSPHSHAALEYWFFKVNAGPVALLVDWIARRPSEEQVLRVSIHSPAGRDVLFGSYTSLTQGENTLTMQHTSGKLGSVEWDLTLNPGTERIAPQIFPTKQLRMFDLTLVSAPMVTFTGWMRHGPHRVDLERAPGIVSHYWGRQLAEEWWWLSATQLEPAGFALEAAVSRSGLWGLPAHIPLAYLYLLTPEGRHLWIAPPARAQVSGTPEAFTVEFRPLGGTPLRISAQGCDYGSFGDNIINTSVGNLQVYQGDRLVGVAEGTAGLERRAPAKADVI